ncbi:HisA/HisF-related TIM barrel protein [Xanthobacter oligotrophicus]|uniref:HisA/HisF-related TIM barrel protein n=1 Tax=Xanthobacter oligotrophicus TaxID=2607286 RepID=UPI0011F210A0|nr:HisA/HisF-related TIM barrel protein [Xanthobacter oligotrophicus]MCG5237459.1 HisA/HisF-related TIM barrel protein [Xanthobacter oligotrophicus]
MQLIPVVDLKGGCVVHARRGERDAYRPIHTPLAATSAPVDVVAGLLALASFRTLYVADLDAIAGTGGHGEVIDGLRAAFPHLDLWVDAGEARADQVRARAAQRRGTSVIGTETLPDVAAAGNVLAAGDAILSLDHDAAGPRGPVAVHEDAALWPERVIVMTLARVGSGEGPDLAALERTAARAAGIGRHPSLYAAGGVRGPEDLDRLAAMGTAGVLVASALHDGRIGPDTARLWA